MDDVPELEEGSLCDVVDMVLEGEVVLKKTEIASNGGGKPSGGCVLLMRGLGPMMITSDLSQCCRKFVCNQNLKPTKKVSFFFLFFFYKSVTILSVKKIKTSERGILKI